MPCTKPHVLIIGAGIGGLALAQMLRRRGIPFSVFERGGDEDEDRAHGGQHHQGWAIALHGVLPELVAALPDDLPPLAESVNHLRAMGNAPAEIMLYPGGQRTDEAIRLGDDGTGTRLVRANRALLRRYLRTNIEVRYNKRAVAAAVTEDGDRVTVTFEDGTSAQGDILVGADGVHSAIRRALVPGPDLLQTLPFGSVTGEVTLSGAAMRRQLALGRSAYILRPSYPGSRGQFFVGTNIVHEGAETADFYWMMLFPEEAETKNKTDPGDLTKHWHATSSRADLLERAVAEARLMDPVLSEVVRQTPADGIFKPPLVYSALHLPSLPVGRMTLLGDAAHSMPPFRGEGGVNALMDALRLDEAIGKIASGGDAEIGPAMEEYQKEMLERGNRAVTMSVEAVGQDFRTLDLFNGVVRFPPSIEVKE